MTTPTPPTPTSYPWVNFKLYPTSAVDSSPVLVFGTEQSVMIDSMRLTNTSANPLLADVFILREISSTGQIFYIARQFSLAAASALELLDSSVLYLESGDTLWGNSDFSGNTYDCLISYRQLLES
jgi:hypothetical protein